MKIVIDECLPKKMTQFFIQDEVWSVTQIGLSGYSDSKLLDELQKRKIDLFITIDGNIEYQQQFKNRPFGTIVIRSVSNRFEDLIQLKQEILAASKHIKSGTIKHIPSLS